MIKLVDDWLRWKVVSRGRSETTAVKYRGYLVRLLAFLDERDLDVLTVDAEVLESWTGMQLFNDGLSARSRRAAIAAVKGFFSWIRQRGLRGDDPAEGLFYPKSGRRLPRPMMLSQAERILKQPDLDTLIGIRDLAILFLFIGCGLRVSDLCRLNMSSLVFYADESGRERLLIRAVGKGNKERYVPAPDEARLMVRAYINHPELAEVDRVLEDGDQVLFVSMRNRNIPECDYVGEARRLAPRSVNDMLAKYGEQAGVDRAVCHPHALRHLYGKELMEEDINLLSSQALLGHSKADTTAIYSHIATRKLTEAADKANPLRKIHTPVTDLMRAMKDAG